MPAPLLVVRHTVEVRPALKNRTHFQRPPNSASWPNCNHSRKMIESSLKDIKTLLPSKLQQIALTGAVTSDHCAARVIRTGPFVAGRASFGIAGAFRSLVPDVAVLFLLNLATKLQSQRVSGHVWCQMLCLDVHGPKNCHVF